MASKKRQKEEILQDKSKFIMSGIAINISGTLAILFLSSLLRRRFLIHLSIDGLVGAISFSLLLRNLQIKYRLIGKYTSKTFFIVLDFISLGISILVKIFMEIPFDLTLPILLMSYFISKTKLEKFLNLSE